MRYDEDPHVPSRRKPTARWCKGHVGREHDYVWRSFAEYKRADYMRDWELEVCAHCGRERHWRNTKGNLI